MANCPQDRTGDARSVHLFPLFPPAPPALGRRSCLNCGVTGTKVSADRAVRSRRPGAGTVRTLLLPWVRAQEVAHVALLSQHQEEDQHDQQDRKEDGYGTPLAPICKAGHED